ncbi:hypothetical protein HU200_051316 [Digitaria exilis]|uniref:DUF6598 domain-containing protein n=1 Tax=Digitaria exilis TaxID=1010633 RepID=A0A835B0Z9_9POAL|nr:hypothetical protein HU200_051316 [Digitaria exilis]
MKMRPRTLLGVFFFMADADGKLPSWVEAEAMEARLSMIQDKIRQLLAAAKNADFSGMNEAERAAKQAEMKEERLALIHEFARLASVRKDPDYSGMTETERAAEAERRRQQALQEARRLQMEGHPLGQTSEARGLGSHPRLRSQAAARLLQQMLFHPHGPNGPRRVVLSTVDVICAVVIHAVEATIAVEFLQGDFYGAITAYTTSIKDRLVLYDSEVACAMTGDDCGAIHLMRPIVSVSVKDILVIVAQSGDSKSELVFTPRTNGEDEAEITVGATRMRVKVAWSVMNP